MSMRSVDKRRMVMCFFVAIAFVCAAPAGLAAQRHVPEVPPMVRDTVELPSWQGTNSLPGALLVGARVTGDAVKGCVWIGTSLNKTAALWPPGYHARFAPVRVFDERGRQVWSELHQGRQVGGGYTNVWAERIPEACRIGKGSWWVAPMDPM